MSLAEQCDDSAARSQEAAYDELGSFGQDDPIMKRFFPLEFRKSGPYLFLR